jgi:hypothetical protein
MKAFIHLCVITSALLATSPSFSADSQTNLAITQLRAAQDSFYASDAEQGRQHLFAAKSHAEVALRHKVGADKKDLKIGLSQIKEATDQAQNGQFASASDAAGVALEKLRAVNGRQGIED